MALADEKSVELFFGRHLTIIGICSARSEFGRKSLCLFDVQNTHGDQIYRCKLKDGIEIAERMRTATDEPCVNLRFIDRLAFEVNAYLELQRPAAALLQGLPQPKLRRFQW